MSTSLVTYTNLEDNSLFLNNISSPLNRCPCCHDEDDIDMYNILNDYINELLYQESCQDCLPEFKQENENKYIDKKLGKFNDDFLIEMKKLQHTYNKRLHKKWQEQAEKPIELFKKKNKKSKKNFKFALLD